MIRYLSIRISISTKWYSLPRIIRWVAWLWWIIVVRPEVYVTDFWSDKPILGNTSSKADGATADPRRMIGFQRLLQRLSEHFVVLDGRQPVGSRRGEVIAGT